MAQAVIGRDSVVDDLDTNYFVCTLGQAALINAQNPHKYSTISEFIDFQAQRTPNAPAVGIPRPPTSIAGESTEDVWPSEVISFSDLQRGCIALAKELSSFVLHRPVEEVKNIRLDGESRTVALLLLLIACYYRPQCQPSAIAHLYNTCDAFCLLYDSTYELLAQEATRVPRKDENDRLLTAPLPFQSTYGNVFELLKQIPAQSIKFTPYWTVSENDTAYLHHTSGTSTGLPKPIPQSHRAGMGVLPSLTYGHDKATFTTTPLYHGGVADLFRAWTSGAMVWMFPGKEVPITATNILRSLECAEVAVQERPTPSVKYFSSVPYVLQMMASEKQGLAKLQEMDLVGVGGAALTPAVGDDLVQKGLNLVSRFGSAECGFLMSSHRNYSDDRAWQYLRSSKGSKYLKFEPQNDDTFELVVLPGWPHMAKKNRPDGSFATADLFATHPTIHNAWKYHSRADSQLTLTTGKKFDPAPVEASIATSSLLDDVLVFGNGQPHPGALLFRSLDAMDAAEAEIIEAIWPDIERLNAESQTHTRISRKMLVVMLATAQGLEKSSKGTVMRRQAEEKYQKEIQDAYEEHEDSIDDVQTNEDVNEPVADEDVPRAVLDIIKFVVGNKGTLAPDQDFFSYGVDSVACMQIRSLLRKKFLSGKANDLSLNIVYDCGTINRLSKFIINIRRGQEAEIEDEERLMLDLVDEYSIFEDVNDASNVNGHAPKVKTSIGEREVIVLTGATGALGAHLLDLFRARPNVSQIICLVRATDIHAGSERINKSLLQREKKPLDPSDDRIICVPAKLGDLRLGLSDSTYANIAERATIIVHAAWAVNFSMRLRSFTKDHIAGLRNLINLALHSPLTSQPPHFLFCSSTASVLNPSAPHPGSSPIPEFISSITTSASPLGYSRSKWVAEQICANAYRKTRLGDDRKISVLRIGQLCGDTRSGVWNVTEAWPLMLSSVAVVGSLPDLDEPLSWLPVDIAATAISQIAFPAPTADTNTNTNTSSIPIYHILNPDTTSRWTDLLTWLGNTSPYTCFETVAPAVWVDQLDNLKGEGAKHPARKLVGLWRDAYCDRDKEEEKEEEKEDGKEKKAAVEFEMQHTFAAAPIMRTVRPIDEEQSRRIWTWIEGSMLKDFR
ncbi:MAG: putative NRPS-like protein biosynthetic cluster [Pycnora praestabilis]|nr:MAG: putative NRPS-like protein biosynthetic cluster [Pycnora praestabilis]